MKYIVGIIALILTTIAIFCFTTNGTINNVSASEFLRIHIRANSNEEIDQDIKYKIKDEIVEKLTPIVANVSSKTELKQILSEKLDYIKEIADTVLSENGFSYKSNAKISNEEFPTRNYGGYTLDSGFYDCLIVELGNAVGNNWWCVIYPPLCFLNYDSTNSTNFVYKSKIWEIINQFFN